MHMVQTYVVATSVRDIALRQRCTLEAQLIQRITIA